MNTNEKIIASLQAKMNRENDPDRLRAIATELDYYGEWESAILARAKAKAIEERAAGRVRA